MIDGGSCGGRAKRQRSNSGAGKGVKAVLAMGSKGAGVITRPPPGGIRAGRPRPARQAGRCTPPPLPGAPWQRVLCGPKGPVCCGDSLSDIPAAWVPIPPGSGAGQVPQRRPGPRAPPSIPVRGDGGWMCGGWSFAPVRSRRAANMRKEYIQVEISREMFETANLWRHR